MHLFHRWLAASVLILVSVGAAAQQEVPYTTPNEITLTIPGNSIPYAYFSNRMLVRLNQENTKIEMRVPLSSFTPANTGSPVVLLHELMLAGSFPELILFLDAPADMLLSDRLQPETRNIKGVLMTQGIARDIETEIQFVPLPNQASLSATFSFDLSGPNVMLPRHYFEMTQGVVEVVIQNARLMLTQKGHR